MLFLIISCIFFCEVRDAYTGQKATGTEYGCVKCGVAKEHVKEKVLDIQQLQRHLLQYPDSSGAKLTS